MATVMMTFKIPAVTKKKQKWYVSGCPLLDIWSQGETEKKARENLVEAIRLFLISCVERGTLDRVLRDCGFTPGQALHAR